MSFHLDKSFGTRLASPLCVFVDVHYFFGEINVSGVLARSGVP